MRYQSLGGMSNTTLRTEIRFNMHIGVQSMDMVLGYALTAFDFL